MINKIVLPLSILTLLIHGSVNAKSVDLTTLYEHTINNNPQLTAMDLSQQSAAEAVNQVDALGRPQVSSSLLLGGLENDYTTLTETDSYGAEVSISVAQNLYNSQLNANQSLAVKRAELSEVVYTTSLQQLTVQVVSGYFNTLKVQEHLTQLKATQQAVAEQLKQTEQRFKLGLIPETDVQETRAQYDMLAASMIAAENNVKKALGYLYELSGQEFSSVQGLNVELYEAQIPAPTKANSWLEQAQSFNPEMLIQQQLVSLSKEQISAAQAGHMPSIGMLAEYRYAFGQSSRTNGQHDNKADYSKLQNNSTLMLGVQAVLPVYSGGATSSLVEQASLNYLQAVEVRELTWRGVSRQVRDSELDIDAAISAQQAFQQVVLSASTALRATEQGFKIGSRTSIDVLNATQQLYAAKRDLNISRFDFVLAALQLKFLAGELSHHDITSINTGLER